jgi:hypothetical protein
MAYQDLLVTKQFVGNVVIRFKSQYFCIRQPDSGLSIGSNYQGTVKNLVVNPTQVDLKRVSTTIASYSFELHDKMGVVSSLFAANAYMLTGEAVDIWIGRTSASLDFSGYYQLPQTRIKAVTYDGNMTYSFSVTEQTDRMNKSIFNLSTTLAGDISAGTTTILVQSTADLSTWPSSGIWRIDDEFGTYAGVDNTLKELTGCTRGLKGTTAAAHKAGATVYNVVDVTDNPLNILLSLLTSRGGGGAYDTLIDGVGLSSSLVDLTGIASLRDTYFSGQQYSFSLYDISNALQFIETEILQPCNLRLTTSSDSKLSVVILDKSPFNPNPTTIDENSITNKGISWTVDATQVINQIAVQWDWDEGTQTYKQISNYSDSASITQYGAMPVWTIQTKGIKASLLGQTIVDALASALISRFKQPYPQIEFTVQMDKSLLNVGNKATVNTTKLPTSSGNYAFSAELEVYSRGINYVTGDVAMKMMFTRYSAVRQCFIAPTHYIQSVGSQSSITLTSGGGAFYTVGWPMRIFNTLTGDWLSDGTRIIQSIAGDVITFTTPWSTTLANTTMRLTLPKYDETVSAQRAYCFIGVTSGNFPDGTGPYLITF